MSRSSKELLLLSVGAFALGFLIVTIAMGRDLGQYAQVSPELRQWYGSLHNKSRQLCCADADGWDAVWDTKDGHYRVRADNAWIVVPDEAVVEGPNKAGVAKVWFYTEFASKGVRCFMPGSQA